MSLTDDHYLFTSRPAGDFLSHLSAETMLVFGHHLRGHEGRGPRRTRQEGVGPLEFVAHAKVCDLDVSVISQQQVGGFNVSVDDLVVVHCTETMKTRHISSMPVWEQL